MVPPLFTSASRQKPQWVWHSQTQSAVTGAPDIPYFPMEVQAAAPGGNFTDDTDLLAATGGSLHSNTQATSSLHHSNDIVDMIWILHYVLLPCQRLFLYASASFKSSSAPFRIASDWCAPPVRRASSALRPGRSRVSTQVYVRPFFSSLWTE